MKTVFIILLSVPLLVCAKQRDRISDDNGHGNETMKVDRIPDDNSHGNETLKVDRVLDDNRQDNVTMKVYRMPDYKRYGNETRKVPMMRIRTTRNIVSLIDYLTSEAFSEEAAKLLVTPAFIYLDDYSRYLWRYNLMQQIRLLVASFLKERDSLQCVIYQWLVEGFTSYQDTFFGATLFEYIADGLGKGYAVSVMHEISRTPEGKNMLHVLSLTKELKSIAENLHRTLMLESVV